MSDVNITSVSNDKFSNAKRMADGLGDRYAEQVSVETDRLAETVSDGVDAVRSASKTYGTIFADTYVRMIEAAVRNATAFGDHLIALAQVKSPADAVALNYEFGQKQMSSMQQRFLEVYGLKKKGEMKG